MKDAIRVRHFREDDSARILVIEHASFGKDAYDRNLFASLFQQCGELFLVAEHLGSVCGYMTSCIRKSRGIRFAEVISIAVDPDCREAGVASSLMKSTLRRLRRRDIDRLTLMVRPDNGPALAFYKKFGFQRVRTVRQYYGNRRDGLLMRLQLGANNKNR